MSNSNLYILRPRTDLPANENPWDPWFDKSFGHVVRANSEQEARELANKAGGEETGPAKCYVYRTGGDPWLSPNYSTCEILSSEGPCEVIITDFASA